MNKYSADIGYRSILHCGEELCGDHVAITADKDGSVIVVLADGLGSGVKASIFSTLTSKIISTMLSEGMDFEQCVSTVADTLPVCADRGVAYSTFTVVLLKDPGTAEIIQYENPDALFFRGGDPVGIACQEVTVAGKVMKHSRIDLQTGDQIVIMSDGCPYAGPTNNYNMNWSLKEIGEFVQVASIAGYSAKTIATMLTEECERLYDGNNRDDATACVIKIKDRCMVNLMFGPPSDPKDCGRMMEDFFRSEGKHIICGGTTSEIAAEFLGKKLKTLPDSARGTVPPMSTLEGADLVTEGLLTMSKVLEYAMDYLNMNSDYPEWTLNHDGASQIARTLFEEATDVSIFVGQAVNPAYQNPDLPFSLSSKMSVIKEIAACLQKIGMNVHMEFY